jgi:hypothetical protein
MTARKTKSSAKSATPRSSGMGMLALFRDLWRTFQHKDNYDSKDGGPEYEGVYEVIRSMSFIQPVTAMEALAQAAFLFDKASDFDRSSTLSRDELDELSKCMECRAAGLAAWIERTHGIDRREFKLNDFCDGRRALALFPDAPLRSRPESRRAAIIKAVAPAAQAAE